MEDAVVQYFNKWIMVIVLILIGLFYFTRLTIIRAQALVPATSLHQRSVEWFPFLGEEDDNYRTLITPGYGITVITHGFNMRFSNNHYQYAESYTKKNGRTKKPRTIVYLNSKNSGQFGDKFLEFADQVMDDVDSDQTFILRRIDEGYERVWNLWNNCPKYHWVAQNFRPNLLRVELRAVPWWNSYYGMWAAGEQQGGRNISVLVIGVDHIGHEDASLKICTKLADWEIGNAFGTVAQWPYLGIQNEIGDQDPCTFVPKTSIMEIQDATNPDNGTTTNPTVIRK